MKNKGPLSGVVVLDLSRVLAGPYSTMILADLGARVIKVEAPGNGDDARNFDPFIKEKSAYFMSLNRGKESIALNLKEAEDRDVFEHLVKISDVLVENYRPGTMEKLGYGWDFLKKQNPKLVYAAISGFGHSGPYSNRAAYDMVVQGMGGIMSITGHEASGPTRVGTSVGDITAGLFGVTGVLSALFEREKTGEGMMVDVGMLDCQVAILENAIARYTAEGTVPGPMGGRHPSITPFEVFEAKDGHIIIAAGNDVLFTKLCDALNREDLRDNPLFACNMLRTENHEKLTAEMTKTLRTQQLSYWFSIFNQAGIPYGPINNVEQVLNDPQVNARNMVITTDDPVAGTVKMAGNPIKLSRYADPIVRKHAPDLDEHRMEILAFLMAQTK
ncbi:MAG: CoA transferase [Rhodospirillales bacterium]|jgi:CoA:oxalate CoA-transferase|nr:CoA transferase [Rhodospirillales bacterium]